MYTQHSGFFMVISMHFEDGASLCWLRCLNRWKSALCGVIVLSPDFFMISGVWPSHYYVVLSCSPLGHTSQWAFHPGSKGVYNPPYPPPPTPHHPIFMFQLWPWSGPKESALYQSKASKCSVRIMKNRNVFLEYTVDPSLRSEMYNVPCEWNQACLPL